MYKILIVITVRIHIDGLVQKRRNSIAKALELRLSCTKPIDMKAIEIVIEWIVVIGEMGSRTYRWLMV